MTERSSPGSRTDGRSVDPGGLDPADVELLRLLGDGLSVEQVARRSHASERTVRRRYRTICDRLGVRAPIQAVVWAARRGLL